MKCSVTGSVCFQRRVSGVGQLAHVGPQRVVPDVGDVLVVERQRDTPIEPRLGSRDAKILQRFVEHPQRLVAVALGPDEIGIFLDVPADSLAVFLELQEIVSFFDRLGGPIVYRADVARQQFLLGIEALASDAVEALVVLEINVAGFVSAPEHLLHERLMHRVGGADKKIVADVQPGPSLPKQRADFVGEGLRMESDRFGGALVLVAMLVGAGQEGDVGRAELAPLKTCERVRRQHFVGMADMGRAVAVDDRGRDVDAVCHQEIENSRRLAAARAVGRAEPCTHR